MKTNVDFADLIDRYQATRDEVCDRTDWGCYIERYTRQHGYEGQPLTAEQEEALTRYEEARADLNDAFNRLAK